MSSVVTRDTLGAVGIAAGLFVVLVGLGTLAGTPWQYANSGVVTVSKIVGSLAAIAVGGGLAWFLYTTE